MRPPELHIVLVRLGRLSKAVDKVEKPAVFLIPASLNRKIKHLHRVFAQLLILLVVGFLHQEPAALDVMSWVDHPSCGDAVHEFAVYAH